MINKLRVIRGGALAVVTATPDFNPLEKLKSIEKELNLSNYEGSVVFDLFARNGLSSNRFVAISFDGYRFDRKSFRVLWNTDENLKIEQDFFFRNDPNFLKGSVLSSFEVRQFMAS